MSLGILLIERMDAHIHHIEDYTIKFNSNSYLRGVCEFQKNVDKSARPPLFEVICCLILAHILEALYYNY